MAFVAFWATSITGWAQTAGTDSAQTAITDLGRAGEAGRVELFGGIDLNYADVNYVRLYNVLVNLTPGVKWHIGKDWMMSGQAFIPLVNSGYEPRHSMVRLTNAALAKQLHLGSLHLKLSGGLFGADRYGLDVKAMLPVTSWLMFYAQAGFTGDWRLAAGDAIYRRGAYADTTEAVSFGRPDRFTGLAGLHVWLERWQTEFRLTGGRYVNEDLGLQLDVMRHFRHCTVIAYAQLHQRKNSRYREAGGFKVVVMLPQWTWRRGKFSVRPASNFRLTYNAQADGMSMKMYTTDPEENERVYPVRVPWGLGKR